MVKINKIEYEPQDMPPDYNHLNHWEEVMLYECHPDFSDRAMHFRGYIIAEYKPWMNARPDIYRPEGEGKVRINEVFVDRRDWERQLEAAWRDMYRRQHRWVSGF